MYLQTPLNYPLLVLKQYPGIRAFSIGRLHKRPSSSNTSQKQTEQNQHQQKQKQTPKNTTAPTHTPDTVLLGGPPLHRLGPLCDQVGEASHGLAQPSGTDAGKLSRRRVEWNGRVPGAGGHRARCFHGDDGGWNRFIAGWKHVCCLVTRKCRHYKVLDVLDFFLEGHGVSLAFKGEYSIKCLCLLVIFARRQRVLKFGLVFAGHVFKPAKSIEQEHVCIEQLLTELHTSKGDWIFRVENIPRYDTGISFAKELKTVLSFFEAPKKPVVRA